MQKSLALVATAVILVSTGCDSQSEISNGRDTLAFELPSVDRTIADAEAADLALEYSITVNDAFVDGETYFGAGSYIIPVPIQQGDTVNYEFYWWDTNFIVDYAINTGSVFIGDDGVSNIPVTSYQYEIDSDGDGFTNRVEIDGGFSPISANDNPGDPVTLLDVRRDFVNSTSHNDPIFGCNNSPAGGTSSWYWNFETNGTISGIELDAGGNPNFVRDRGNYLPVGQNLVEITNELGEAWVWELNQSTQDLVVNIENPWGECTRIDGGELEL